MGNHDFVDVERLVGSSFVAAALIIQMTGMDYFYIVTRSSTFECKEKEEG